MSEGLKVKLHYMRHAAILNDANWLYVGGPDHMVAISYIRTVSPAVNVAELLRARQVLSALIEVEKKQLTEVEVSK